MKKIFSLLIIIVGIFVLNIDAKADCELGVTCHYASFYIDGKVKEYGTYNLITTNPGEEPYINYEEEKNQSLNGSKLPSPIKDGYNFDGWYYDDEYTKKVGSNDISKLNLSSNGYNEFYGRWVANYENDYDKVITNTTDTTPDTNTDVNTETNINTDTNDVPATDQNVDGNSLNLPVINKDSNDTCESVYKLVNSSMVEVDGVSASANPDNMSVTVNIDWSKNVYTYSSSSEPLNSVSSYGVSLSGEVEKIYVVDFGRQSPEKITILYLMKDGTIEYTPIYKEVRGKTIEQITALSSYGKIDGVSEIKDISVGSLIPTKCSGGSKVVLAIKNDDTYYDLTKILEEIDNNSENTKDNETNTVVENKDISKTSVEKKKDNKKDNNSIYYIIGGIGVVAIIGIIVLVIKKGNNKPNNKINTNLTENNSYEEPIIIEPPEENDK